MNLLQIHNNVHKISVKSDLQHSTLIEQFAFDLTEFILKEQPCYATKNSTDKTLMATEEHY